MRVNNFCNYFNWIIFSVLWILNVGTAWAQCGLPGTPPCRTTTKKIPKKIVKKKTATRLPSKNTNSTIEFGNSNSSSTQVERKTSLSVLANVEIPGYSGILVESMEGEVIFDSYSNFPFNPASTVQIATAYAVLKTFGPDYRFPTSFWTDGQLDLATGTLYGNLYVTGRDPMFNYEHAVAVSNELNQLGIRRVAGDLLVTDNFTINYGTQAQQSGNALQAAMNSAKRSAVATRSWNNYLATINKTAPTDPNVIISGRTYVQALPTTAKLIFSHESAPMREIIKTMLCYSNNFLAERLGDMIGGAYAVARTVQLNAQIPSDEFYLQTSSRLGKNRVTPRAMMKILRVLQSDLKRSKMNFTDIMAVAGIDQGVLKERFNSDFARGSVAGSLGTMENTDGGASSLAGEIQTKNGKLLFVVFNNRGGVQRFRAFQNSLISIIQRGMGGAVTMLYNQTSLDERLAVTRITYPETRKNTSSSTSPAPVKKPTMRNEDSPFRAEYVGGNGLPIVQVTNSSDRLLILTISGKEYKITAGSSEDIVIEPGNNTFTASAVRVRTLAGTHGFDRGYRYTWEFRIIKTTR